MAQKVSKARIVVRQQKVFPNSVFLSAHTFYAQSTCNKLLRGVNFSHFRNCSYVQSSEHSSYFFFSTGSVPPKFSHNFHDPFSSNIPDVCSLPTFVIGPVPMLPTGLSYAHDESSRSSPLQRLLSCSLLRAIHDADHELPQCRCQRFCRTGQAVSVSEIAICESVRPLCQLKSACRPVPGSCHTFLDSGDVAPSVVDRPLS